MHVYSKLHRVGRNLYYDGPLSYIMPGHILLLVYISFAAWRQNYLLCGKTYIILQNDVGNKKGGELEQTN